MNTQATNLPPEKCSYEARGTSSGCEVASYASEGYVWDVRLWLTRHHVLRPRKGEMLSRVVGTLVLRGLYTDQDTFIGSAKAGSPAANDAQPMPNKRGASPSEVATT